MDKLTNGLMTAVLLCALPLYCDTRSAEVSTSYDAVGGTAESGVTTMRRWSVNADQDAAVIETRKPTQQVANASGQSAKPDDGRRNIKQRDAAVSTLDSPPVVQRIERFLVARQTQASNHETEDSTQDKAAAARRMDSDYLDDYPEYLVTMSKRTEEVNVDESQQSASRVDTNPDDVVQRNKMINEEAPSEGSEEAEQPDEQTDGTEYEGDESADTGENNKDEDETSSEDAEGNKTKIDQTKSDASEADNERHFELLRTDVKPKRKRSSGDIERDEENKGEIACKKIEGLEKPKRYAEGDQRQGDKSSGKATEADKKQENEMISDATKRDERQDTESHDTPQNENANQLTQPEILNRTTKSTEDDYIDVNGERIPFVTRKICTEKQPLNI